MVRAMPRRVQAFLNCKMQIAKCELAIAIADLHFAICILQFPFPVEDRV
jgi:hypothetical protein